MTKQIRTWTQRQSHTDLWMGWRKFMRLIADLKDSFGIRTCSQTSGRRDTRSRASAGT